jgi:hypothetical protein
LLLQYRKEYQLLGFVRNKLQNQERTGEAWKAGDSVKVVGSAEDGGDFDVSLDTCM